MIVLYTHVENKRLRIDSRSITEDSTQQKTAI